MAINIWMLSSFLSFINEDSIMFNLSIDNEDEAMVLIKKVYSSEDQNYDEILQSLKDQCFKKSADTTSWKEAICGSKNWKCTIIAIVFTSLL